MNSYYISDPDGLSHLFHVWSQLSQDKASDFLSTPFGPSGENCSRSALRDPSGASRAHPCWCSSRIVITVRTISIWLAGQVS